MTCRFRSAAFSSSAGAGGAPPTKTSAGSSSGDASSAETIVVSTVGAAHRWVTPSSVSARQIGAASTFGRHTCLAPAAVTAHVYAQPLQWNIGSVHR